MRDSAAPFTLPDPAKMPGPENSTLKWLAFFAAPYRRTILIFSLIRLFRFTVLATMPLAIGRVINAFESGWAYDHTALLGLYLGAYLALYAACLLSVAIFYRESVMEDCMVRGLTLFSVQHMNALPLGWHEAQGSGNKLQRVMAARNGLKQIYRLYKWHAIPFLGTMTGIVLSIMMIDAPLWFALLYIGFGASFFSVALLMARSLPDLHDRHNKVLESLMGGVYEFVSAIRTVKAFHMNEYIERRAVHLEGQGHSAMRGVMRAIFTKWTALNATAFFWILVFVGVCIGGIFHHWLSVGAFATCFFLANNLWGTLEQTIFIQDEFIEARNGFLRLRETLCAAPQKLDLEPVCPVPSKWQKLSLNHVSFSYRSKDAPALHDITLDIRQGEKVALVGKSGAGKSTLIKILLKQAWPDSGTIAIDGADLRHIDSAAWLHQIGYVPQDVELFNMSVRDNILLDRIDNISEGDYRTALEQAALSDFITFLPEGDATFVGERGVRLSGGQRQRLGIARALVRKPELVIFDEATSALDSLSEDAIRQAIETSFAGKTLVMIAHRLSTVRHVDRIFVLDEGRLIEQGGFSELLARGGQFAKLWALQSDHYEREKEAI